MIVSVELSNFRIPMYVQSENIANLFKSRPVEGRVTRWKEELILELSPEVNLDDITTNLPKVARVRMGDVLYWSEGKALCIFAGLSQPYCEASLIGQVLASPTRLLEVSSTSYRITVPELPSGELRVVIDQLSKMGYTCSVATLEDGDCIACVKNILPRRLYLEIYVEDAYIHVCTCPIILKDERTSQLEKTLYQLVETYPEVRLDTDHYGNLCLSAVTEKGLGKLCSVISKIELSYVKAIREVFS